MQRRLLVLGTIILSLFLFSYSCQDHQLPGVPPALVTLKVSYDTGRECQAAFSLDVLNMGNIPVSEFGVVVSGVNVGNGQVNDTPTVDNATKVVFDPPFSAGIKTKLSVICSNNMYYRAYAVLNNGTTVYGEVLRFNLN